MANLTLHDLVATRLTENPPTVEGAANLVLSAFQGLDALRATLDGDQPSPAPVPDATQAPTATYLAAIEVEGFRGIGPPVTLTLEPSPGLTLVVGRNGSGKSSFAEALEMLLTGSNRRWTERAKVWQDGWRNLHHGPP
ncbi:MAG: ATP-binding protein, partial [Nitrososphaerales archaeon]